MFNRLRDSPWVRTGLLVVVIGFCVYGVHAEWPQAETALDRLDWYSVVGAALASMAGAACFMLAWRALLSDLGSRLPVPAAIRTMFVAQLAKYLPGAVWAFAAQVEIGNDYQVPRSRNATSVVTALAVTLGTGLLAAAITLPLTSATAARHYWWALAVTPVILVLLYPPVLGRLINKGLTLIRQPHLDQRPSARGLLTALGLSAIGWLLWGLQSWLLVSDITGRGTGVLLISVGAYALAWSAGILIVVFPGGIGPRELAFIAALAPVTPRATALVIALVSRVVMTASDLIWGGTGIVIGKVAKRSARRKHGAQVAPRGDLGADLTTS